MKNFVFGNGAENVKVLANSFHVRQLHADFPIPRSPHLMMIQLTIQIKTGFNTENDTIGKSLFFFTLFKNRSQTFFLYMTGMKSLQQLDV